jgi:superfamily II DNA or RNA helicase
LGVSATAKRSDGLTDVLWWTFGPLAFDHEMHEDEVRVQLKKIDTGSIYIFEMGTKTGWTYAIGQMAIDSDRNKLICRIVREQVATGKHVLVLSERVDHVLRLESMLKGSGVLAERFVGETSNAGKERNRQVKAATRAGIVRVMCATYKMASEGVDIPVLDCLVFASPPRTKGGIEIVQSVGRVKRPYPGKECALVFDLVDGGTMQNYWFNRRRIYRTLGEKRRVMDSGQESLEMEE